MLSAPICNKRALTVVTREHTHCLTTSQRTNGLLALQQTNPVTW
eukprot:COSAG06_NODE_59217_length_275_cov_0.448864_1_plen_43_part_10